VKARGSGSVAEWRLDFQADGLPDIVVKDKVSRWLHVGLDGLKSRFGALA
jgi:hypothetical protein